MMNRKKQRIKNLKNKRNLTADFAEEGGWFIWAPASAGVNLFCHREKRGKERKKEKRKTVGSNQ